MGVRRRAFQNRLSNTCLFSACAIPRDRKNMLRMYLLQKYDALNGLDHAEFISKDVPPWHISAAWSGWLPVCGACDPGPPGIKTSTVCIIICM